MRALPILMIGLIGWHPQARGEKLVRRAMARAADATLPESQGVALVELKEIERDEKTGPPELVLDGSFSEGVSGAAVLRGRDLVVVGLVVATGEDHATAGGAAHPRAILRLLERARSERSRSVPRCGPKRETGIGPARPAGEK